MTEEFGISEKDQEILDRLKSNREKRLKPSDERSQRQKKRQQKETIESKEQLSPSKKPMLRGTISPDILIDTNGDTLLKWVRYVIHDNKKDRKARMLNIPKQISFDGCVVVCYNTKSKVLTITPQKSNTEALQDNLQA